jgi:hypothetical protein
MSRLDTLIAERARLRAELERVNKKRFRLQHALDRSTTRLCKLAGLPSPGDMLASLRKDSRCI